MHVFPLLPLLRFRLRPLPVVPRIVVGIVGIAAITAGLGATFSTVDAQGNVRDLYAARHAHTQVQGHRYTQAAGHHHTQAPGHGHTHGDGRTDAHGHAQAQGHTHAQGYAEAHDLPAGAATALVREGERRALQLEAVLQRRAFEEGGPPDGRYHALVNRAGGAAARALFVTDITDAEIARALRELGADDGGGVPLRAWTLRNVPLLPQPSARVKGSRIDVTVHWEGAERRYDIGELLLDSGGRGIEMRFGGNEEHDAHWDSGCILCLFSCPGGVISNARYSIREHVAGATRFSAGPELPEDGTPVTITLHLSPR